MAVYFVQADTGQIKIGYSTSPKARIRTLQTASPARLTILCIWEEGLREDEQDLHDFFKFARIGGEWFRPHRAITDFIVDVLRGGLNCDCAKDGEVCPGRQAHVDEMNREYKRYLRSRGLI